jgi:hypothetical protein
MDLQSGPFLQAFHIELTKEGERLGLLVGLLLGLREGETVGALDGLFVGGLVGDLGSYPKKSLEKLIDDIYYRK